ncbi:MAG: class I SAM-dependent methyltransferase [Deltaproteobacteria bacterium]|nr:class I SAM-dependent methyltransferase [Deltaproteobacteria bacterium]
MSSLALMRWLEGRPERYDAGMRVLTCGRIARLHAAVAEAAVRSAGDHVLEIGCGTGTVTTLLHARGAHVTAIDQAPEMLEQARLRLPDDESIVWIEQTAAEIDRLPPSRFDAVVLCLCLSDMSPNERAFVLREAVLRLAPGGRVVAADEVRPNGWRGWLQRLWRIPQAALGWLLVGSLSRPIRDLAGELQAVGLRVSSAGTWLLGTLELVVGEREP